MNDWAEADHIVVQTTRPNDSSYWRIELQTTPQDSARIDIEVRDDKQTEKGTILVVERGMATKDLTVVQGYEIDALDVPVLQTQLVLALLRRAFPRGPAAVREEDRVDITERRSRIEVAAGHAAFAVYGVPWSLRGAVRRKQGGLIEYALTFTAFVGSVSGGQASRLVCQLAGMVRKLPNPFALPDSFALQGWRVFRLGPSLERSCLDYVARPLETPCRTVAELRQATPPWTAEEIRQRVTELISRRKKQ
jgi:hypothetical protein